MCDAYGRIICIECGMSMISVKAVAGEAVFKCVECPHIVRFTWPIGQVGEEKRTAA